MYTYKKIFHIIVVEIFAGSYPGAKLIEKTLHFSREFGKGIKVIGYIGVEMDKEFYKECPPAENLGLLANVSFFNLNGDLLDSNTQGAILNSLSSIFSKAKVDKTPIDAIVIIGGPSCNTYSKARLPGLNNEPGGYPVFAPKCYASDRLVIVFLYLFNMANTLCAAEYLKGNFQQKMPKVFFVMENPHSVPTAKFFLPSRRRKKPKKVLLHPFGLLYRPFLQVYLEENGGFLKISQHSWCRYRMEHEGSQKDTTIFSNLCLKDYKCNCLRRFGTKVHDARVLDTNGAHERAKWPQGFLS